MAEGGVESVNLNSKPIEIIICSDCRHIVSNFIKEKRADYESFCKIWNGMRFHNVFTATTNAVELQQVTKLIFHYCKRTLCLRLVVNNTRMETIQDPPSAEEVILQRIGALYLMYTIYYKQPFKEYVKIEVCLTTWTEMKEFMEKSLPKTTTYDEARYTFWKLFADQAFTFAASDFYIALDNLLNYDELYDVDKRKGCFAHNSSDSIQEYQQLRSEIPTLLRLEEKYNEAKQKLADKYKLNEELLPKTDVFGKINTSFEKIQRVLDSTRKMQCIRKSERIRRSARPKSKLQDSPVELSENEDDDDDDS